MEHYKTLGLISSAEQAVIKAAYKALVSIYHPDKNNDKPDDKKIKDINKAYAVLSNPVKKKEYDIEIENNNASISAFSINSPFYIDPLEKEWAVAVDFYPEIKRLYNKLAKISWSLSFVYKVQLIESKDFKKSKKIYEALKHDYLLKYFGDDESIINYAEQLIISREIDTAIYLNSIIKIMGESVSKEQLENKINKKYPNIKGKIAYLTLKNHNGFHPIAMNTLVDLNGGKTKEALFNFRVVLELNNSRYEFKDSHHLGKFILETFASKYNV